MSETFSQYLEKWLKQSTVQGLNNPLVKMPVKRFRLLQLDEFNTIAKGGTLLIGTNSDPIARNLHKNYLSLIRERGEHCAFVSCGAVEMIIAGAVGKQPRTALFPVFLKRASLEIDGDKVKVTVFDEISWEFNPVLQAHLREFGITSTPGLSDGPENGVAWVKAQLGNRASIKPDCYVGLFSSQQMVLQQRLTEPSLRQSLARNPVIQAKIGGIKAASVELGETTDEGIEGLGLVLPCDDYQLRVVQLSDTRHSLQVEGPPGTGKSQTIANIISNALYKGRRVLLVCDKREAIVQVEKRLTGCGLKPALLNLHDEDLDKREFLKQATEKFSPPLSYGTGAPPVQQLQETRKTLNERVKFGRTIAHPSLQVTNREALAGLIRLRKELQNVPKITITNWQSLSKERLKKLLQNVAEWPDFAEIASDSENVWNKVRPETFDENPGAANELENLVLKILLQIESLDEVRELTAQIGIELPIQSDQNVIDILELISTVIERPVCHPEIVGNSQYNIQELDHLKLEWEKREILLGARYPLALGEKSDNNVDQKAKDLLSAEAAVSWQDLSQRQIYHKNAQIKIEEFEKEYLRLCNQIGLLFSPLLSVRRSQFQAVLSIGSYGGLIPSVWWSPSVDPVLMIESWINSLKECSDHEKTALVPLYLISLERVTATHWEHVEFMAEHGFNVVTYFKRFVHDRKSKYALKQAYPSIPARGFDKWFEVTQHAVKARGIIKSLRERSESHPSLKQLAETYLGSAHENDGDSSKFIEHDDVKRLRKTAALVKWWHERSDLFEVTSSKWQLFWQSSNTNVLLQVQAALANLDSLVVPNKQSDNLEEALQFFNKSRQRIEDFLTSYEKQEGDRTQSVLASFAAQKEFAHCQENLAALTKYLTLQDAGNSDPDWERLRRTLAWRDKFEKLCGRQKLDVDSPLWLTLRGRLQDHHAFIEQARSTLSTFFEACSSTVDDYDSFKVILSQIIAQLPQRPLWLEKKRWQKKILAFPELMELWSKVVGGSIRPDHAERLFCFNLLWLCDPIAKPQGPELKQTLRAFEEQDSNLASWIIEQLKSRLRNSMQVASSAAAHSEAELRRLAGMQRIRGTTRELVKAHLDYLIAAKPCWMMSPTSLANLLCGKDEHRPSDFDIFEKYGAPFDLVIFDEASQIRVLDGMLSMAFGKQVIIVGDKHQLPPTDFFLSFANTDTEADSEDFGISESLLNEFEGVFDEDKNHVMLMSHYRSETPDLIRFSNDWFYGRKLEMYPPAHISGIGRRLHYVPNATYSETTNPVEAREVVTLIELHVREYPGKSLGIVTMNMPQMKLIDELLESAPLLSPAVRDFCADERKFFLKNLETVQGDEMDRIIVSLTYGKNPSGQFNATILGPLTKNGGERRLNVAISRSRSGMVIVSSLKAADLAASGSQSNGFKCLQALLIDLESMEQVQNFGIGNKRYEKKRDGVSNIVYCESPFEEQVVEFLENEGFELECQYGDGRFRLDIVVKEKGRNLLAIECDGAAFHSSLVARTRDRARQRILEQRGWQVHRVWSTNWWVFEDMEKKDIINAINTARSNQKK